MDCSVLLAQWIGFSFVDVLNWRPTTRNQGLGAKHSQPRCPPKDHGLDSRSHLPPVPGQRLADPRTASGKQMGADPHWESHQTAPQERTSKHHQRSGAFEVPKSSTTTLESGSQDTCRCRYPAGPNDLNDISNNARVWSLRSMHLDRLQSLWPASPQALPVQHASIRSEGNRPARRWPWTVSRLRCQLNTTRATGCCVT